MKPPLIRPQDVAPALALAIIVMALLVFGPALAVWLAR